MKFIWAMVVITLISAVLGVGMLLGSHGYGWWVLLLGIVGFLGLFVRYGCRTH